MDKQVMGRWFRLMEVGVEAGLSLEPGFVSYYL